MSDRYPAHEYEQSTCTRCGKPITGYIVYDRIAPDEYIVNDAWWSHHEHPVDEHDAEPGPVANPPTEGEADHA